MKRNAYKCYFFKIIANNLLKVLKNEKLLNKIKNFFLKRCNKFCFKIDFFKFIKIIIKKI